MRFQAVDEMSQFSFDDSVITELKAAAGGLEITFAGAVVRAGNSQNKRFQDMPCGEIVLKLEHVRIARLMKEGMKYYDADGTLQREIPDEDVPVPAQDAVLRRLSRGTVFTVVEDPVEHGYACEFGIDVPREEDEEEVDTFWLCLTFDRSTAMWDRYCAPEESV
ncbi:MAG: hypothetical protein J6C32_06535 [Eubacterium sp.]|nr:hypothetical protein [Eubacterium sp.]